MSDCSESIFINRTSEIKFLENYFQSIPNSLLFIYGPKSSGKSSFLEKVATNLDKTKYAINFLDLRQVMLYNFKTFLDVFFPKNLRGKVADILNGITFNTGFFSVKLEEESALQENPFAIITEKLQSAKNRNIQPIIIIDEIQLLKNIYINGERHLIDQLFNLFIALTKVKHLAHVVLATSDSYFIEEIYNSAKLGKTSDFFLLEHFDEGTVYSWLKKEDFAQSEIEAVWHNIGGCPWEIREIIRKKQNGENVEDLINKIIEHNYGKINEYRLNIEDKKLRNQFDLIIKTIVKENAYIRKDSENTSLVKHLLKECIALDMWFYKPEEQKIIANSQSIYRAFEKTVSTDGKTS
jgi:uncharacterized protein